MIERTSTFQKIVCPMASGEMNSRQTSKELICILETLMQIMFSREAHLLAGWQAGLKLLLYTQVKLTGLKLLLLHK